MNAPGAIRPFTIPSKSSLVGSLNSKLKFFIYGVLSDCESKVMHFCTQATRLHDSRLEGGVNRAKLKFTNINTTTSRVSVRNKIESAREGTKQIASE
jgi:hypothetical protein